MFDIKCVTNQLGPLEKMRAGLKKHELGGLDVGHVSFIHCMALSNAGNYCSLFTSLAANAALQNSRHLTQLPI